MHPLEPSVRVLLFVAGVIVLGLHGKVPFEGDRWLLKGVALFLLSLPIFDVILWWGYR